MSQLQPVHFSAVQFTDNFWAPRLETNRTVTLPHALQKCEETGRLRNFAVAGKLQAGEFEGIYFNDSDVYKVLEGAAYCLATHPDPELDRQVDEIVAMIAAAQQEDGYLNTYYTLVEPAENRWTDLPVRHELYCAGHLFEAAAAHKQATGKKNLLQVAARFADCIDQVFGDDALVGVCGHEEVELALLKLAAVTGEQRYFDLAQWFVDRRGSSDREYCQDHMPVREQSEVVGHAVRAMYLYCAMADLALVTGDEGLRGAVERVWRDLTLRKLYVTGGVGPSAHNEGFTQAYDMPNDTAYAETCAAIGLVLWGMRMLRLNPQRVYGDAMEQALYNGYASGVALSGDHFFYVNPLASGGAHHRQPWFDCACCPSNVVRFIPQLGSFAYATGPDSLWVHLYAASELQAEVAGQQVSLTVATDYPWDGLIQLTVQPAQPASFALHLRLPGWCREASLTVNGEALSVAAEDNGYLRLSRDWQAGDVVELTLAMPVERIAAHPRVPADRGRVALRRGPAVYCLEGVDNGGHVRDIALPREAEITPEYRADLLGGVTVLRGQGRRQVTGVWNDNTLYQPVPTDEPVEFMAVPYSVWDNREPGEMVVWLPETTTLAEFRE